MRRVILKISGESLKAYKTYGFDENTVLSIIKQIKEAIKENIELVLLLGGGNILRGKDLESIDKYKADEIGMLSTVINGLYFSEMLKNNGVDTSIYGSFEITDIVKLFNKDAIINDLKNKKVVILVGGTGHPYFTTDSGVVLRGIELNCDEVILAKSIDAVYDSDPAINKNAKRYDKITFDEIIEKKLRVIDLTSATLCNDNNMPIRIFLSNGENNILRVIKGEDIGTLITV